MSISTMMAESITATVAIPRLSAVISLLIVRYFSDQQSLQNLHPHAIVAHLQVLPASNAQGNVA
ncbi:hypothetical protein B878_14210 [Vibrio campbellii CAIM 519 = NBRC 15631 = ATCC 25920]|nr:hypothetical protein B878_14210 [Vibrio campbellii CAIM 519 = NBRC 15631 = ATCC 25920]